MEVNDNQVPTGLKRLDFETGVFTGKSGKKYRIESNLSIMRYAHYQMFEKEFAYGMNVEGIFKKLKQVFELLNKMKFAEAAALVHDMMRGVMKIKERQPAIMKICCLYINAEDEDRGTINQDMIDKKIEDWGEYAITDFFQVATLSVRGLTEIYENVVEAIMDQPADLKS